MKENEAALLEASRQGGRRPDGPDVKPPEPPEGTPPPAMGPPEGAPPEGGGEPGARGQEIRKKLEELVQTTQDKGGSIPKEIEELIKMIPTRSSQSPDQPDSDPKKNEGEARKPRDQKPE